MLHSLLQYETLLHLEQVNLFVSVHLLFLPNQKRESDLFAHLPPALNMVQSIEFSYDSKLFFVI